MENPNGDTLDGLEIISIGNLYNGSWEKKYWSSSRGKERYPYPIGYHAVRTHIGITYKMEIREGLKGPLFEITSTDGQSCTGQTPDIAWELFQKKGGPRVKLGHGKRFSCKIDGVELFGFRNPLVQRLLRELAANVNGTAERSSLASSFCDGASRPETEAQTPDPCAHPDLLPYLVKLQSTRKRSRKHKFMTINAVSGVGAKRLQTQDLLNDAEVAITRTENQRCHSDKKCSTSSTSDDDCQEHKATRAMPITGNLSIFVDGGNDPFSVYEGSLLESPKFADSLREDAVFPQEHKLTVAEDFGFSSVANNLSKHEKHLDRSLGADMQRCDSIMPTGDNSGETASLTESRTVKDLNLCAPDTFDTLQDSAPESNKLSLCQVNGGLASSNTVVSKEKEIDLHPDEELGTSTANASSEKSDFESVGQELAKSMMTLLLPQALPLLKKRSNKRRVTSRSSEISLSTVDHCLNFAGMKASEDNDGLYYHLKEVRSPDKYEVEIPVEGNTTERDRKMHILGTDMGSEYVKSVPDSFEDDQYGNHVNNQGPSCSGFVEADEALFDKKEFISDTLGLPGFVGDVGTDGKNEILYGEVPGTPDDGNRLCLETHSKVDNYMDKELEVETASIKDILGQNRSSHSESISNCEVPNFPTNEPSNNLTGFRNIKTEFSPKMVASSSKAAYFEKRVSLSSTKNLECVSNEIHSSKLVQYHRRHCSSDPKSQSTDIHWDQANPNTHGNQDDIHTHGLTMIRKSSGPLSESIICRNTQEGCVPETCSAIHSSFTDEIGQAGPSSSSINREVSFGSEIRIDGQQQDFNTENGILRSNGMLTSFASRAQAVVVQATEDKDVSRFVHPSISDVEWHQVGFQEKEIFFVNNYGHESEEILADLDVNCHMKSVTISGQYHRNLPSQSELHQECMLSDFSLDMEPNKESGGFVELVGCYMHPSPVLSILLSKQGDEVHISVLCGLLEDRNRTIFIYKVPIKGPRGGCPSFLGYTSMVLPTRKDTFCREIALERCGFQFTPDGQYLVFLNSIKAPSCRERSIHCSCSVCALDCLEENAVKVVHVKLGYVSLVTKLKTSTGIHCVLVCEPSHLIAVEEGGRLHAWVMNTKWSAWIEEFILPSLDYASPCIVEIKRIPKCAFLVIGHNGYGDFGLWDISKRVILSRYSAPGNLVFQVLPVGLFRWEGEGVVPSSPNIKEQIEGIMATTEKWFSGSIEDLAFLSSNVEDIAVWLLVSATHDSEAHYDHRADGINSSPDGCWKLALLMKNMVIFGSVLDPRASSVDESMGHGIIGTRDGLVYIWELSTGRKLVNLHYFKGGHVSSIAADSKSGMLAVAGDKHQLMVFCNTLLRAGRD